MNKQEYQINSVPLTVIHKQTYELKCEMHGTWIGDLIGPFLTNPILMGIVGWAIANVFLALVFIVIQVYAKGLI